MNIGSRGKTDLEKQLSNKPCRIWKGAKDKDGYGTTYIGSVGARRQVRVHRLVWKKRRGNIPKGINVLHHCDNPSCWEIEHLFLGTHLDNAIDRNKKGRQAKGEKQGSSRLTFRQVLNIRQERNSGMVLRILANKYQVSISTISRAARGDTYSDD